MTSLMRWIERVRCRSGRFLLCAAPIFLATFASWTASSSAAESSERWTRAPRSHFVGVVKETCKAVVSIQGEKQYEVDKRTAGGRDGQYDVFNGMGTGVVIDERGYILTNYHVVKGLLKLEVLTSDGERYRDVELIRNDVATDLAILKIKPKKSLTTMRMGRAERVELAEDVFAIGNPYGYHCSITRGIVSSVDRPLEVNESLYYDRVIQTDAAINPGNSGGPLINVDGEMIGLNAAVREEAENIAFAIPIDVVAEVAERMLRQSAVKMTHHGLKFRVVDSDMPEYPADGNGEDALVVESVEPKSPAADAEIQPGDVLLSVNGLPVRSSLDFTRSLIGLGLSDSLDLRIERAGETSETMLAFSDLGASRAKRFVASDGDSGRFAPASTSSAFAQEVADEESVESLDSDEDVPASRAARSVWEILGLEVTTASAEEYAERFPNLQAVAIGEFNFAPNGGVNVERVDPNGPLASGPVKLQKDDFIFGFGVGTDKEGQLSVASVENLYYIAQRLDEFAEVDSGAARVYLIRGDKPYFLEIDLNEALDR